jgi:hypothetical protein
MDVLTLVEDVNLVELESVAVQEDVYSCCGHFQL